MAEVRKAREEDGVIDEEDTGALEVEACSCSSLLVVVVEENGGGGGARRA